MRPYVFTNMVASVDGKTAVAGRASGLGTAVDRAVMRTLRSRADAVMIGGATLRAEKLSLGLDEDDRRPWPLAVVLTNTGDVPLERNLVRAPRQKVVVVMSESAAERAERRLVRLAEVRRAPTSEDGSLDLGACLRMLGSEYGVCRLLVEGGRTLNYALLSRGLVDELFLTLAPRLLGGAATETSLNSHGVPAYQRVTPRLLSVYRAEDEMFLRYSLG